MESLLGRKDVFTELSNEIAERTAILNSKNIYERIDIKKDIKKKLIITRGKILHSGLSLGNEGFDQLKNLEDYVVNSIIEVLKLQSTIKTEKDLTDFFEKEKFYPSPSPEMSKELRKILKEIKTFQKKTKPEKT